jgi:hypothetical protein
MPIPRLIEPRGRPHIECPRCRTCVVWPESLLPEQAAIFAKAVRASALEGANIAHTELGLDLRESKSLVFHVTKRRGFCHRCEAPVSGIESVCTKCRSANLDW